MAKDRGKPTANLTRRGFLIGAGAVAAGMAIYSGEFARHEISVIERDMAIRRLPAAFHGFRVVQISDIHMDEFTEPYFLEEIVGRVNRMAPDLVLLTGDFITRGSLTFLASHHAAYRCAEILSRLKCDRRIAVLGNHDVSVSAPLVIGALATAKIPVLQNLHIPIEKGSERFWLCGVEDPATSHPDLTRAVPARPDGPVILMAHEPDYADAVVVHPRGPLIDLMLSGHTHGGQIRLPVVGAMVLPPMGQKYVEGLFRFNRMQLYVNRGIGAVGLPFRLNCPPEITLFHLRAHAGEANAA